MNTARWCVLAASLIVTSGPQTGRAEVDDIRSVSSGEAALAFAAGAIQKFTPRDGIVNLITGDNQTTGNRMLLGKRDLFYLQLTNPTDVAVGDLYTVYRRVRKVFHPATQEYLGFATIRVAVVRVLEGEHPLTTVEAIQAYGTVSPGDLVMRFASLPATEGTIQTGSLPDVAGMIVDLPADRTMTMVSQSDIVYLDRGREDGLKNGDLMDVYRHSAGLPSKKIGQLKVLATEDRTATAKVTKATTRIMRGDRYKGTGYSAPLIQPVDHSPAQSSKAETAIPRDLVASKLKVQDAAGQSRINLGELSHLLHFDSGEAVIKSDSYKVLDQLIEYLRTTGDERLIRVEGHADNVEIGPSLKSRYASNWDLSKARASGVVRYLVEKGGLDSARLTSVGYGDSLPAMPNVNEEGRNKNRRVEILLYAPQTKLERSRSVQPAGGGNLSSISGQGNTDSPATLVDLQADSSATQVSTPAVPADTTGSAPTADGTGTQTVPDADGTPAPDSSATQVSTPPAVPAE
jgi:chemotaxis protein MotB